MGGSVPVAKPDSVQLRLRLGGGVGGSVLVVAPDSVHSTLRLRVRGGLDQF